MSSTPRPLGLLLREEGVLSAPDLERALRIREDTGERLGEVVVRLALAPEEAVARALARQLGLPYVPPPLEPEAEALRAVPRRLALRHRVLPLRLAPRSLRVAMGDPLDLTAIDELRFLTGRRVEPVVTTASALRGALGDAYAREVAEGPVARLLDALLERALEGGASDVHVEQARDGVAIRERVDGLLRRVAGAPRDAREALLSRIKVVAGMDIAVKRRPQDGGFALLHAGRRVSVRVSTLPVEEGEKAVLRLLDPTAVPRNLEELGLGPADLAGLRDLLGAGRGVILAAGPTGSGKSSTLFGALGELDRESRNVVTLEDPIEYRVDGVSQVQMNPRAGLTFPSALRAVLRQDPDVIMVGEIRDGETAEIAMAAAVTGHLVLSTIHTVDAPGGVTRLLHMGVPPHLVAGGLSGIVAQRLVRRTCPRCGGDPAGCASCHRGYRGRTGVFELLVVDDPLREEILAGGSTTSLRRRAREGGMGSMGADARRKVAEGVTTPHEVSRMLHHSAGDGTLCPGCGADVPFDGIGCPHCGARTRPACACGRLLRAAWRFCPGCLRRASPLS